MLTGDKVREVLDYCPTTGVFTWAYDRVRSYRKGEVAGCTRKSDGYRVIRIDDVLHYGHRLAYLWMMDEWPKEKVDHWDGDTGNNAWSNLRATTNKENGRNSHRQAYDACVWQGANGLWSSYTTDCHRRPVKKICARDCQTKQEAIDARRAALILEGYSTNHGANNEISRRKRSVRRTNDLYTEQGGAGG